MPRSAHDRPAAGRAAAPNISSICSKNAALPETSLDTDDTRAGAADIQRGLIDRIVLTPTAGDLAVELHGDLFAALALCEEPKAR